MFVLIVFKKGSTSDPITVGVSTMEALNQELSRVEYVNIKAKKTLLSYVLFNGAIKIIDSSGKSTEQGELFVFKAKELAKLKLREELIEELEEKKKWKKDSVNSKKT